MMCKNREVKVSLLLLAIVILFCVMPGSVGTRSVLAEQYSASGNDSSEQQAPNDEIHNASDPVNGSGKPLKDQAGQYSSLSQVSDEEIKLFIRAFHDTVVQVTNNLVYENEALDSYLDLDLENMRKLRNILLDDLFRTKLQIFNHPELYKVTPVQYAGSQYKYWYFERENDRIYVSVYEDHELMTWPTELMRYATQNGIQPYPEYLLLSSGYKRYELHLQDGHLKIGEIQTDELGVSSDGNAIDEHMEAWFNTISAADRETFISFFYNIPRSQMEQFFIQLDRTSNTDNTSVSSAQANEIKDFLLSYHLALEKMIQSNSTDMSLLSDFMQTETSTWQGMEYLLIKEKDKKDTQAAGTGAFYPEPLIHRYHSLDVQRYGSYYLLSVYEEHLVMIEGKEIKTQIYPLPGGLMEYLLFRKGKALYVVSERKIEASDEVIWHSSSPLDIGEYLKSTKPGQEETSLIN